MSSCALPSSLAKDPNYQALNRLLDRVGDLDLTKLLIYWLDDVDASALPHLAKQFHVLGLEGWDYASTEAEKRALLKQAVELHRYKGTPWAVRQGIQRVSPDVDIEEWFEYGGQPYYFRIRYRNQNVRLTIAQALKLFYVIESLKSLRSKLEGGIEAVENVAKEIKIGTHVLMHTLRNYDATDPHNSGAVVLSGCSAKLEACAQIPPAPPLIKSGRVFTAHLTRIEVS